MVPPAMVLRAFFHVREKYHGDTSNKQKKIDKFKKYP